MMHGITLFQQLTMKRLYNAIWISKIGRLNETEALDFINSGELGYYQQTEQEIKDNVQFPIKITRTTYYKYKSTLESPEYQTKQVFKLFRDEYMTEIMKNLYESCRIEYHGIEKGWISRTEKLLKLISGMNESEFLTFVNNHEDDIERKLGNKNDQVWYELKNSEEFKNKYESKE